MVCLYFCQRTDTQSHKVCTHTHTHRTLLCGPPESVRTNVPSLLITFLTISTLPLFSFSQLLLLSLSPLSAVQICFLLSLPPFVCFTFSFASVALFSVLIWKWQVKAFLFLSPGFLNPSREDRREGDSGHLMHKEAINDYFESAMKRMKGREEGV